nr:hypothetical protein [Tanacetum cinerariifolium]
MPALEDVSIFNFLSDDEDDVTVADINNLDTTIQVSPILTTRIHKDHPLDQVIGDLKSASQTRKMSKNLEEHGFLSTIQQRTNHKDPKLLACLLFITGRTQKGNLCIERSMLDRGNAGRASTIQVTRKEIDYDVVFSSVARIEAIRLFLAYASFKDFVVYQMDVKSAFLYGKIEEEVYVCQPPGFEDPNFPGRVYNVKKALRTYILLGITSKQKKDGIFISQYKYVAEIIKKFRFIEVKTASTPMETQKPLLKDEDGEEVDVHIYRYQVNLKVFHLYVMKRIFRYLKGQPKLGIWYLKDSPFELVPYIDSDYDGASLDRKSTTEDKVVHKELGDILVRAATTASSLEAEQDSGGGPRCQKTMGDTTAQTRFESVSRHSNDSLLARVGLSARVKSSGDEESLGEDASKQGRRIDAIDADEDITLVNDANKKMFDVDDLGGKEVFVAWPNENVVEEVVNVAQDKGKGIIIEEPVKPKKKDQIRLDEEAAKKLQAKFNKEERLARE